MHIHMHSNTYTHKYTYAYTHIKIHIPFHFMGCTCKFHVFVIYICDHYMNSFSQYCNNPDNQLQPTYLGNPMLKPYN